MILRAYYRSQHAGWQGFAEFIAFSLFPGETTLLLLVCWNERPPCWCRGDGARQHILSGRGTSHDATLFEPWVLNRLDAIVSNIHYANHKTNVSM
jgi:hypothetical protein